MWKSEAGQEKNLNAIQSALDDDWETGDVEPVTEKQQRWGKCKDDEVQIKVPLKQFAQQVTSKNDTSKLQEYKSNNFARGYGGQFGVEKRTAP